MTRSRLIALFAAVLFCLAVLPLTGKPAVGRTPSQEELLVLLRGEASWAEKWDAARLLARTATPAAVPELAAMLADERTAELARCALQAMPDAAAGAALSAALATLQGQARVGVINSLGVRRDAQAVEPLARLLADPDLETVKAAAAALGMIATAPASATLEKAESGAPDGAKGAMDAALLRYAEGAVAAGRSEQAQAIFDRLRDPQKPDGIRMAAIRGAIVSRGNAGAGLLLELIAGEDPIARSVALRVAAHEAPGAAMTMALAEGLKKIPTAKQSALLEALGQRGDASAVPALLEAARQGGRSGRLVALRALPRFANPQAVPVLAAAATDADGELATAARQALASFPGGEADAAIRAMLESGQPAERLSGIRMAQDRRMASAVPVLLKSAQDGDSKVRLAALKALGELTGEADLPELLNLLSAAPGPQERAAAEQALAAVIARGTQPEAAIDLCIARMADAPAAFHCSLLRVLGLAGGAKALAAVQTATKDPDEAIRSAALRSLIEWKSAEAAPVLLQIAAGAASERDRLLCLRSCLGFANAPAVPAGRRVELCKQVAPLIRRDEEKIMLLGTLGGIAHPQSLALILPHLQQPALKEEACTAVLRVAETVLKGRNAAAQAARLVPPLEQVARVTADPSTAGRAQALLKQAQAAAARAQAPRGKKK